LKSGVLTPEQFQSVLVKAQEQGELVLDAKQELGRVIANTPSGTPGVKGELRSLEEHNKKAVAVELGITHKQAANYQAIARHPEAVEKAKTIARENNDIPTESLVLQIVKAERKEAQVEGAKASIRLPV
jgi:hypothetical protein